MRCREEPATIPGVLRPGRNTCAAVESAQRLSEHAGVPHEVLPSSAPSADTVLRKPTDTLLACPLTFRLRMTSAATPGPVDPPRPGGVSVIMRDMSGTSEGLDGDLRGVANGWLAAKAVEGPSPATQAARRADLAGVAACLADVLERPDAGLPAGASAFDQHLAQLCLADLSPRATWWPLLPPSPRTGTLPPR
jgi:hypothetical protein